MTGDIVKTVATKGKYVGIYFGRITVRRTGSFDINVKTNKVKINHKYCRRIHKSDGYVYHFGETSNPVLSEKTVQKVSQLEPKERTIKPKKVSEQWVQLSLF
jgi:hypothetical protein